jgi:hypothetical protein
VTDRLKRSADSFRKAKADLEEANSAKSPPTGEIGEALEGLEAAGQWLASPTEKYDTDKWHATAKEFLAHLQTVKQWVAWAEAWIADLCKASEENDTLTAALEYCQAHILDTCNESQTMAVIKGALKGKPEGERPPGSCPDCGRVHKVSQYYCNPKGKEGE